MEKTRIRDRQVFLAWALPLLFMLLVSPAQAGDNAQVEPEPTYVQGELLYMPCHHRGHAHRGHASSEVFSEFSGRRERALLPHVRSSRHPLNGIVHVRFDDPSVDVQLICRLLSRCRNVEFAEPNYVFHLDTAVVPAGSSRLTTRTSSRSTRSSASARAGSSGAVASISSVPDPFLNSQGAWGQSFLDQWGLHKIEAPAAWAMSRGEGIVVAVVDTGVYGAHPDIAANMWHNAREIAGNGLDDDANGYIDDVDGWNFLSGSNDVEDDHGHGTHVAGIIGAVEGNGIGIAGVAPSSKIMPLKALDDQGMGVTSDFAGAIEYAASNGARVINNSWGGGFNSEAMDRAFEFARSRGCVVTAAAGNDHEDMKDFYPAAHRLVLAVGASDREDRLAAFSNFGPKLDVLAPGGGESEDSSPGDSDRTILSLRAANRSIYSSLLTVQDQYARGAGTSMACPHVSGIAALLLARHPAWLPEQVRAAIRASAEDLGAAGPDSMFGAGRVNARRALLAENPTVIQVDTVSVDYAASQIVITGAATSTPSAPLELLYRASDAQTLAPLAYTPGAVGSSELARIDIVPGVFTDATSYVFVFRIQDPASGFYFTQSITLPDVQIISVDDGIEGEFFKPTDSFLVTGSSMFGIAQAGWRRLPDTALSTSGLVVEQGSRPGAFRVRASVAELGRAGTHAIRLDDSAGHFREVIFHVDASLFAPGLPGTLRYFMQLAELDGDPAREVVVSTSAQGGTLYVYEHTGALKTGYPKEEDPVSMVVDLDRDGLDEIITTRQSRVWDTTPSGNAHLTTQTFLTILDAQGNRFDGTPVRFAAVFEPRAAADLDGDGDLEVILLERSSQYAITSTGFQIATHAPLEPAPPVGPYWTALALGFFPGALAVGDLDRDGRVELVLDNGTEIVIASPNGSIEWHISLPPLLETTTVGVDDLVLADIDRDAAGDLEIVVRYRAIHPYSGDGVYAYRALDHDGSERPDFQLTVPTERSHELTRTAFVLGDLTGDGVPEMIVFRRAPMPAPNHPDRSPNLGLWAYDRAGSILPGWPVVLPADAILNPRDVPGRLRFELGPAEPLIGDVNADGRNDVVVVQDDGQLYAYGANGAVLPGWPRPIALDVGAFPVQEIERVQIGDLEGDGFTDILLARHSFPDSYYTEIPPVFRRRVTVHTFSTAFPRTPYRQAWLFANHDPAGTRNLETIVSLGTRAPVFDAMNRNVGVAPGNTVEFTVVARDADGDPLSLAFDGPAPSGATLTDLGPVASSAGSRQARFRWMPTAPSVTSVAFSASDGTYVVRSAPVLITVSAAGATEIVRAAQITNGRSRGWTAADGGALETYRTRMWVKYNFSIPSAGTWELEVQAVNVSMPAAYAARNYDLQVKVGGRVRGTLSIPPNPNGPRFGTLSLGNVTGRRFPKALSVTLTWTNSANTPDFKLRLHQLTVRKTS